MRFGKIAERKADIRRQIAERKKQSIQRPQENSRRRIAFVGEKSDYYRYKHLLVGKMVEVVRTSLITNGYVCRFVYDEDRKKLNAFAGWSDEKKEYMFNSIKFKE